MKATALATVRSLTSTYWFLPVLMLLASAALAEGLVLLDYQVINKTDFAHGWLFQGGAQGARSLLVTVAGAVISVAGTTFSITIAVLSLTSSQYGPRLLRGFLRDVSTQAVLGTLVGTFLYCLLVLRTVREESEGGFIPYLAITGGVALAVASVFVFVYLIHHISTSVQISTILGNVAKDLDERITDTFPAPFIHERVRSEAPDSAAPFTTVLSAETGYLEAVDRESLVELARRAETFIELTCSPGAFLIRGQEVARIRGEEPISEHLVKKVNNALTVGLRRTEVQDVEFLLLELMEVAIRALSPAVNDPSTACMCLDRMEAAFCRIVAAGDPETHFMDEKRQIRLVIPFLSWERMLSTIMKQMLLYGGKDPMVRHRLGTMLSKVRAAAASETREQVIEHWMAQLAKYE